jgi:hypothetical protein
VQRLRSEAWKEIQGVLRRFLQFEVKYFGSFTQMNEAVLGVCRTLGSVEQVPPFKKIFVLNKFFPPLFVCCFAPSSTKWCLFGWRAGETHRPTAAEADHTIVGRVHPGGQSYAS